MIQHGIGSIVPDEERHAYSSAITSYPEILSLETAVGVLTGVVTIPDN